MLALLNSCLLLFFSLSFLPSPLSFLLSLSRSHSLCVDMSSDDDFGLDEALDAALDDLDTELDDDTLTLLTPSIGQPPTQSAAAAAAEQRCTVHSKY